MYDEPDCFEIHQIHTLPIRFEDWVKEIEGNVTLHLLPSGLRRGITVKPSHRFGIRQEEFKIQNNVIMRGQRLVVPQNLRKPALDELHSAHFGMNKIKLFARSYCWWPGITEDVERILKNC
ncbi:hypothetical protein Trydic_g6796 [Trypoxylus dichotomus]